MSIHCHPMSRKSLLRAVKLAGSQSALATAIKENMPSGCKVTQANISQWLNPEKVKCEVPPSEYVIPIALGLQWRMTPHELRSDLYPNSTDAMPKQEQLA
jgi:hypothetical protein